MSKELIKATEREISLWEGASFDVLEDGGKHGRLAIKYNDQSRLVIMAKTPSDHRAVPNHLSVVRKQLRDMGAQKAKNIVSQPSVPVAQDIKPMQATHKPLAEIGTIMNQSKKIPSILRAIEDLRYSEMLEFAAMLSDAAVSMNLRRSRPHDWAAMLQAVVEGAE